jgi:membrane associated rhomboid family serine protease/Zn-finger nucleic acid-binding protein
MQDGSALLCPRCNVPLKEVRTSQGIFWACENCGGRALTVELLRRTFTPGSINPLWLHAISGDGKSGRLCPSCRKPMLEVALSENAQVDVDVCQHCHFVWFDAHEMDTLAPLQFPAWAPELPQEARELMAMEKVRQIAQEARGTDFDSAPPDEGWKQIAGFFGVPVELEAPEEERDPWATWLLSAAIICASVLAFPHLRDAVQRFGLIPAEAGRLDGLTFITSFFLHAGVIHLVGNMYFLLVFGNNVEDFLRPLRYLALIALAAFIGDLAHILADPHSQIPCIGASGGIAGVITFYALKFPHVRLGVLLRYWFRFQWIRLPAWFVFILWILFQIIGAWEQKAGISSVSSSAHLGGATVGVIAWLLWGREQSNGKARMTNVEGTTKSE